MDLLVRHVALPAVAPIAVIGLYFTPVLLFGCVNRGLLALAVVLLSAVTAFATIFVAELPDKTMLATITLATKEGLFGTWLGSTLGMVAADALAILVGKQLGAHLPERAIKIGASALFVLFGLALLYEGLT